jgi:EAL domain-containing protein (putative c-di-GMP-specific phosphodiesterase class I)
MLFVPLAEESGLIEIIGEWVLRTACRQATAWQVEGLPALRMAVNMSPRQFLRPGLAGTVERILRETDLEPGYLDLEITESLLMKDVESAIATMHELKAIGVRLSIDDFGTGYSSLNYLKRFPIDQLKIDKSFLREIETSRDDLAITLAMIAMAHGMGLTVIAEGVENEVQLAFLRANDCDEIQGYHIGRPVPAHEIAALLQKAPG